MLLTLIRILFGVDVTLGLLNYVAWSWAMGQRFNIIFLALSLFSTHLPDWDMIPFLMLRKRYRLYSHWIVGHHPIFVFPAVVLGSYFAAKAWAPDTVAYTVGMITCGVLLHFCHDTMSPIGFPWLSPFTQMHFRFQRGKSIIVSQAELEASEKHERALCRNAASEITDRAEPISKEMFVLWGIGLVAVIVFAMKG
jgi:hypothetical protein